MVKGNIYNIAKLPKKLILLISLSTPLSRVVVFSAILLAFILTPTQDLRYWPIRSLYESLFNLKLYSWGITRSISMILHGEFSSAWELNKLSSLQKRQFTHRKNPSLTGIFAIPRNLFLSSVSLQSIFAR